MSDENNVENPGTSLEEAMQSNVQEQAAEHASAVEDAQEEAAAPAEDGTNNADAALADAAKPSPMRN